MQVVVPPGIKGGDTISIPISYTVPQATPPVVPQATPVVYQPTPVVPQATPVVSQPTPVVPQAPPKARDIGIEAAMPGAPKSLHPLAETESMYKYLFVERSCGSCWLAGVCVFIQLLAYFILFAFVHHD
eukprot:7052810-Prymnesium_polylepis.1